MKKLLLLILSLSMATVAFSSCSFFDELLAPVDSSSSASSVETPSSEKEEKVYKVTFVQNGQVVKTIEVKEGESVAEADIPAVTAKTGYTVTWDNISLKNITANLEVKAVEKANTYEITYNANGGAGVPTAPQKVLYDSDVTLHEPTREGYNFKYWLTEDGKIVESGKWKIANNITLIAEWEEIVVKTYTVTFQSAEGSLIGEPKTVAEGGTLTDIPAFPTDAGYTYAWDVTDFSNITSDMTVTLIATPNTYTVTYNAGEGTVVSGEATQSVIYNKEYTLVYPTVERVGYHLVNWTAESTLPEGIWSIAGGMTINAVWEINTYTVTFKDGDTVIDTKTVEHGATLTDIPTYTIAGYDCSWSVTNFENITSNVEVSLVKTAKEYTITFNAGEGATVTGATTQTVVYNQEYTLNAPTVSKEGYTFGGWVVEGDAERPLNVWTYAGNMTLNAVWNEVIPDTYTITFKTDKGETYAVKTVKEGEALTDIPAFPADAGYTYAWDVTDFSNITSDLTVTMIVTPNTYKVTYNAGEGTIVSGEATQSVIYNKEYTLVYPTVERVGYHLVNWTAESTLPEGIWSIAGGMTINAVWEINTYTVTFKDGDTVIDTKTVEHGATLTDIPTYTIAGYNCSWSVTNFENITSNVEVSLVKTAKEYTITFNAGEGATVTGATTQTVIYNQEYTLNAPTVSKEGYNFAGWEPASGTLPTERWTLADNMTLNAKWTKKAVYTITFVQHGQSPVTRSVEEGSDLTDIPAPIAKTGYTVVWKAEDLAKLTNVTSNLTVNATETANTYTITYVDAKGVFKNTTVKYDEAYTLIQSSAVDGYHVEKFTLQNGTTIGVSGTWNIAENVTITVHWAANTYTVKLNANGGTCSVTEITVTYGEAYSLPTDLQKASSVFEGWKLNGTVIANEGTWTWTTAGSFELTASWQSEEWTKNY